MTFLLDWLGTEVSQKLFLWRDRDFGGDEMGMTGKGVNIWESGAKDTLSHLLLIINGWDRWWDCHYMDDKTEAQRGLKIKFQIRVRESYLNVT